MIDIGDLGPLRLGGRAVDVLVSSPLQRELLACLVAAYPEAVSTDQLLEMVWPGREPQSRLIWTHISRLRRRLAQLGEVRIDDVGGGYRLDGGLVSDAQRFESMVEALLRGPSPSPQLGKNDLAHEPRWHDALALWRGDYLEGFDVERYRPGRLAALRELRLEATIGSVRQRLTIEEPEGVLADLARLTAEHPYSEAFVELTAVGLYQSGRRSESLRRIQAFREKLRDETGLDPGPSLIELEGRILHDDPALPFRHFAPSEPRGASNLPSWRTSFIGRAEEAARVNGLLARHRIVTLVGPAGVGKTRLAVEATATAGQDGVVFVNLGVVPTDSQIDRVVANALGLAGHLGADVRTAVLRHLALAPRLVILDNCEHVVSQAGRLASEIIDFGPGARILATSRERLRVAGESVVRVEPLDTRRDDRDRAPAIDLLLDRAGITLDELPGHDRDAAAELCRCLDGLPLAIELAASRSFSIALDELVRRLDDRFTLLTTGDRSAPPHHRTLAAAVAWSVDELDGDQYRTLIRCSSFTGRFSLDDAAAVCSGPNLAPAGVRVALLDLVENSLVDYGTGDPPYQLLDTLRSFGRDRLATEKGTEHWITRHAEHFAAKAVELAKDAFGPKEARVRDQILAQSADYRSAILSSMAAEQWHTLADLIWGLCTSTFFLKAHWLEPAQLIEELCFYVPEPTPPRWSTLIAAVASTFQNRANLKRAQEACELATTLNPDDVQAWVQSSYALVRTNPAEAVERATKALARSDPETPSEILPSLNILVMAYLFDGQRARALEVAQRLVDEAERCGSRTTESFGYLNQSFCVQPGSPEGAALATKAFHLAQTSGTTTVQAYAAYQRIRHLLGHDLSEARSVLQDSLHAFTLDLDVIYERIALAGAAGYFAVAGNHELAVEFGRAVGAFHLYPFSELAALNELRAALIEEGADMPNASLDIRALIYRAREALT